MAMASVSVISVISQYVDEFGIRKVALKHRKMVMDGAAKSSRNGINGTTMRGMNDTGISASGMSTMGPSD